MNIRCNGNTEKRRMSLAVASRSFDTGLANFPLSQLNPHCRRLPPSPTPPSSSSSFPHLSSSSPSSSSSSPHLSASSSSSSDLSSSLSALSHGTKSRNVSSKSAAWPTLSKSDMTSITTTTMKKTKCPEGALALESETRRRSRFLGGFRRGREGSGGGRDHMTTSRCETTLTATNSTVIREKRDEPRVDSNSRLFVNFRRVESSLEFHFVDGFFQVYQKTKTEGDRFWPRRGQNGVKGHHHPQTHHQGVKGRHLQTEIALLSPNHNNNSNNNNNGDDIESWKSRLVAAVKRGDTDVVTTTTPRPRVRARSASSIGTTPMTTTAATTPMRRPSIRRKPIPMPVSGTTFSDDL